MIKRSGDSGFPWGTPASLPIMTVSPLTVIAILTLVIIVAINLMNLSGWSVLTTTEIAWRSRLIKTLSKAALRSLRRKILQSPFFNFPSDAACLNSLIIMIIRKTFSSIPDTPRILHFCAFEIVPPSIRVMFSLLDRIPSSMTTRQSGSMMFLRPPSGFGNSTPLTLTSSESSEKDSPLNRYSLKIDANLLHKAGPAFFISKLVIPFVSDATDFLLLTKDLTSVSVIGRVSPKQDDQFWQDPLWSDQFGIDPSNLNFFPNAANLSTIIFKSFPQVESTSTFRWALVWYRQKSSPPLYFQSRSKSDNSIRNSFFPCPLKLVESPVSRSVCTHPW